MHSNGSYSIVSSVLVAAGMCLPGRFLAMTVYSDFTIPAFGRHVTISSSHLRLGLPCGLFPSLFFPNKTLCTLLFHACYMPNPSYPRWVVRSDSFFVKSTNYEAPHYAIPSSFLRLRSSTPFRTPSVCDLGSTGIGMSLILRHLRAAVETKRRAWNVILWRVYHEVNHNILSDWSESAVSPPTTARLNQQLLLSSSHVTTPEQASRAPLHRAIQ
jgi:hypothetical protein